MHSRRENHMSDIRNLINNYKFYDGFEDEPEIILSILNHKEYNIHIWEGYIDGIFSNAPLNQKQWTGFTKDYQENLGAFCSTKEQEINPTEYLEDIQSYLNYDLSSECIELCYLMIQFLTFAINNNYTVTLYVS